MRPPDSKILFYVFLCPCIILAFYCIFYAVVRQVSMLFIENKDYGIRLSSIIKMNLLRDDRYNQFVPEI